MIPGSALPWVLSLISTAACEAGQSTGMADADTGIEDGRDSGEQPERFPTPDPGVRRDRHAAALHLVQLSSAIVPWCSGVLVAPDVVVTASSCLATGHPWTLGVGIGVPDRKVEYAIERTVTMRSDPRVSALQLRTAVTEALPASVESTTGDACGVESISYLYVVDQRSKRWTWSGCLDVATNELTPRLGAPNCHGDAGAPAFSRSGGLLGIVVGAHAGSSCVDALELAVHRPGGPFEEAIDLSR